MSKTSTLTIVAVILIAAASWALYSLVNQLFSDMLKNFGINNFYYQNLLIVLLVIIVLVIIGFGGKKALKKIIEG